MIGAKVDKSDFSVDEHISSGCRGTAKLVKQMRSIIFIRYISRARLQKRTARLQRQQWKCGQTAFNGANIQERKLASNGIDIRTAICTNMDHVGRSIGTRLLSDATSVKLRFTSINLEHRYFTDLSPIRLEFPKTYITRSVSVFCLFVFMRRYLSQYFCLCVVPSSAVVHLRVDFGA